MADKTEKEKAALGKPKEQEEELAKPKPQGLKFRNLEGRRSKKGKEVKSKETVASSASESDKDEVMELTSSPELAKSVEMKSDDDHDLEDIDVDEPENQETSEILQGLAQTFAHVYVRKFIRTTRICADR